MGKINLAITGCMGRMGQQLIKSANKDNSIKLVSLTENRVVNKKFGGIKPELNTEKAFSKSNIIIDFTVPKCTFEVLKIASKLKKRVVIGTTGLNEIALSQTTKISPTFPVTLLLSGKVGK